MYVWHCRNYCDVSEQNIRFHQKIVFMNAIEMQSLLLLLECKNNMASLIYRSRKFDHVTPLLHDLHWLRIPERITFRLAVLAYRCQNGLAPGTVLMTFTRWRRLSHGDGFVRRRLRHWSSQTRRGLRSAIALSLSLPLGPGTAFRSRLRHQRLFRFSEYVLKQFYLLVPSRHSNTFLRFLLSPCFILRFHVFSITCFSL